MWRQLYKRLDMVGPPGPVRVKVTLLRNRACGSFGSISVSETFLLKHKLTRYLSLVSPDRRYQKRNQQCSGGIIGS